MPHLQPNERSSDRIFPLPSITRVTHAQFKCVGYGELRVTSHNLLCLKLEARTINLVRSYELNLVSLSRFDDKRYIHKDGTMSYAYGHSKC